MVEVLYGVGFALIGLASVIVSVVLLRLVPALREAIVTLARQEPGTPPPPKRLRDLVRRLLGGGKD